jgi:hypothetical protein
MSKKYKLTAQQQETINKAIEFGVPPEAITDEIKETIARTGQYPMLIRSAFQWIGGKTFSSKDLER